jgi:hypothetical protein
MRRVRWIEYQKVVETDKHLIMKLSEPFWSAYQRYGWKKKVEGYGISEKLVRLALKNNKKIIVKYKGKYEISPERAISIYKDYSSSYTARNRTRIIVVPKNKFRKLPDQKKTENTPIFTMGDALTGMSDKNKQKLLDGIGDVLGKKQT